MRHLHTLFGLILALTSWTPAYAQPAALTISVVPYLSARAMVTAYEPMRAHLEQSLGRPVKIYTSAGFKNYFEASARGEYDLLISAAHFARVLELRHGFVPLVRFTTLGRSLLVGPRNGKPPTIAQLRGQTVAIPTRLSLASIVCLTFLQEQGLAIDSDYKILDVPNFSAALIAVQRGEAQTACSSRVAMDQMSAEQRDAVAPLAEAGEFYNPVFLAHPRLEPGLREQLSRELLKFGEETAAGQEFLRSAGFGRIIRATADDLKALDRYVPQTEKLLAR